MILPGYLSGDQVPEAIGWLNSQHALVYDGAHTLIWTDSQDSALGRRSWRQSPVTDFRAFYRAYKVSRGNRPENLADVWLDHPEARRYREVVFDLRDTPTPGALNLWRGWSVPAVEGDWSRLKEHLFEVIAGGNDTIYDYVIGWMANMVQRPAQPAGTALVFRGAQGAGKGLVARSLGHLLGQHFVHLSHSGQITSRFNGWAADALLVFADEAVWAGDKQGEGALKALITEPTISIERKGRDLITARNVVHMIMASNEQWVAPVGIGDRRFCVLDVPDTHRGDRPYFDPIYHEQANGGAGALLWELLHYDLANYWPEAMPDTSAKREQVIRSLPALEQWWLGVLTSGDLLEGDWPDVVEKRKLHERYLADCGRQNVTRRAAETEFAIALRRWLPGLRDERRFIEGERVRRWRVPTLDQARGVYARHLRLSVPDLWPTSDEE